MLRASIVAAFSILATLNSGGYRYGVSDQAYYVPAIEAHLDPGLFPRDGGLIDTQAHLMLVDEAAAAIVRLTGASLPVVLAAAHFAGLVALAAALLALGETLGLSPWGVRAFVIAMTLRHRIPKTGVNTLEGYYHPRMLAFAAGVWALVLVLENRRVAAVAVLALSALLHPTTTLWFAIVALVGFTLPDAAPARRGRLTVIAVSAGTVAATTLWALRDRLIRMDDHWLSVVADKDYLFATDWPASAWLLNALTVVIIIWLYAARRRQGVAHPLERGLVLGVVALVAVFIASLPFVAARIALAVQLQIPRVFWITDALATLYVVWWLALRMRKPRALAVALAIAAATRGLYVTFIEHRDRAPLQVSLPADDWTAAMTWFRREAPAAHVLAHPGHAFLYGSSVRVAAARDVFLEDVKDGALAMYSREVAMRVLERRRAVPDFDHLGPPEIAALAARFGLTHLVTEHDAGLPEVFRRGKFGVYSLK